MGFFSCSIEALLSRDLHHRLRWSLQAPQPAQDREPQALGEEGGEGPAVGSGCLCVQAGARVWVSEPEGVAAI